VPEPPLVTVTTATLNAARFLSDAAVSVEAQTHPRIEHIIADGESVDGTADLLGTLAQRGHRVLVARDRSMYEAINRAISASEGKIILNLNADDLLFPDGVESGVRYLEQHPEVDIAYGDHLNLYMSRSSFDMNVAPAPWQDPWGRVLVYIFQPAVFVRRRVFERVGLFDPTLKAAGDFEFWFRAHKAGVSFGKLRPIVAIQRLHDSNLSSSSTWGREHDALKEALLPKGWQQHFWEAYRRARRKILLNQLTVPIHILRLPRKHATFHLGRYFAYLLLRRPCQRPILTVNLPYLAYQANRALAI
jgi:glycosyltransferase involved in cell wall biosynthesis